jgi:hypothetical protein
MGEYGALDNLYGRFNPSAQAVQRSAKLDALYPIILCLHIYRTNH